MTAWSSLVESSGILERLNELGPAIDAALAREDGAPAAVDGLERIRTVLAFIGKRLEGADGNLLVESQLQTVSGVVGNATEQLRHYATNGDPGHLKNAQGAMDSALQVFGSVVLPATTAELAGLREAADRYRETMSAQLATFATETSNQVRLTSGFAAIYNETKEKFDSIQAELEGALNSFKTETAAAQETLATTYQGAEGRLETAFNAKLAEWQDRCDTSETTRQEEFQRGGELRDKAFEKLLASCEATLKGTDAAWDQKLAGLAAQYVEDEATLKKKYEAAAAATLSTIEANLKRVQELVGAIGDHGVTAGFKREADDAKAEVTYWQRITFWSMVFLILVGVLTAFHVFEYKLTWIALASRLYLSIATGVLATYAASQANRYQQRERRNRKLELELRALGPFLEPVDPAEREKFRLKIAEVFFGKDDGQTDKPGPATAFELSKNSVDKMLDVAKTAIEKLPSK